MIRCCASGESWRTILVGDCWGNERSKSMTTKHAGATRPEDLAKLFVERANAKDPDGLAALYAPDAVMAFPPGQETVGRDANKGVLKEMLAHAPKFTVEEPLPTVY